MFKDFHLILLKIFINFTQYNTIYLTNNFNEFFQPLPKSQNCTQNLNLSFTKIQHLDYVFTRFLIFNSMPSDNI